MADEKGILIPIGMHHEIGIVVEKPEAQKGEGKISQKDEQTGRQSDRGLFGHGHLLLRTNHRDAGRCLGYKLGFPI